MANKIIISCAITGSISADHTRSRQRRALLDLKGPIASSFSFGF